MKKLVLGTLLLAGLSQALTGCIISSDDDNGGGGGDGILYRVTWACPPDADSITFTATDTASGASLSPDTFDCADGTADILYDAGSYDIDILPEGAAGDFYDQVDSISGVDGDLIQADYDFTAVGDNGFFALTWTLNGEDASTACDANATPTLGVLVTLVGTGDGTDELFDCVDGGDVTDSYPLGDYTIDVSARDDTNTAISEPDPISTSLDFSDQLNDLGNIDLVIQ